jgi:hypothetical protein
VPVIVICPSCRSRLKVPSKLARAGKPLNCPKCRAPVTIPNPQAPADDHNVELLRAAPTVQPVAPVPAVVTCPHCRGQVQNEPTLAGQVVTCPYPACGGQFLMPASAPTAAVATPPVPQHPGSVRVNVLVKQRGFHGQAFADAGAVVLLIPTGVKVELPWPAILPANASSGLMWHYLPAHLQSSTFPQAQSRLRKNGGYAAATGAGGEAYFPTVASGDYTVLILSNTEPDGVYRMGIQQARSAPVGHPLASHYPGLETAETLLDRHFGLGLGDAQNNEFDFDSSASQGEEFGLRDPLRNCLAHEGELFVQSGEETPYSVTF